MNYTKGEWTIFGNMSGLREFPEGHIQIVGDGQRDNIAIIPRRWNNPEANANLIAAAPDMYGALKEAFEKSHNPEVEIILMKALSKAEGKEVKAE